jgi:hypothetical protein
MWWEVWDSEYLFKAFVGTCVNAFREGSRPLEWVVKVGIWVGMVVNVGG